MANDRVTGVWYYLSMLDNLNDFMERGQYQSAYDYLNAIRRYTIEWEPYEGDDLFVQMLMRQDMALIDAKREKQIKGSNGGKGNTDFSLDDRIESAIANYTFKTKAALVEFVEGKRTTVLDHIKRLGYKDEDWLVPSQSENRMPRLTGSDGFRDGKLTDECPTDSLTFPLTGDRLTGSDKDKDSRQSPDENGSFSFSSREEAIAHYRRELL